MKCIYPRPRKSGTVWVVCVTVNGESHHVVAARSPGEAATRLADFRKQYGAPERKRGCVYERGGRFYAKSRIGGKHLSFGGHPSHYEARKALEAGLAQLGVTGDAVV